MNSSLFEVISTYDLELAPNRIDIWQFSLTQAPINRDIILNEEELARGNRFYFPHHKRRFSIARAMLRLILSRYLQLNPEMLTFSYNKYGKPSVINNKQLEFNISHSQDLAILAIGQQFPLGVDLEFFSARPYKGIAKHLFSEQEQKELANLPSYYQPLGFFNIWAQKEAFIKACGMGLSYPTEQFSVNIVSYGRQTIFDPLHQQLVSLVSFMPAMACCAALCFDPSILSLRKITLPSNQDF
ncbi:phosphopantetheinyl transferase [Legionella busanensis]|uniref:Phosphopantetheinyl transferase n=1 Tax=Legionella busanensis TaxID=190655 RepID=A0A378JSQ2_9GAMM|nr:4'-phosphopantetheinyl transferase superfamily protein [Legionella busanensis]STX51202.1 phosphopantetheinyl transferase [Legionella busanensis]